MTQTLQIWATLALAALLLGQATGQDSGSCLPDTPPNVANGTVVLLQRYQWILTENITQPDWNPQIVNQSVYYEYLQPGEVKRRSVQVYITSPSPQIVTMNVTYVSDGDTLCLAAPTLYGNSSSESGGGSKEEVCTRFCRKNFTTYGTRADLLLSVWNDWSELRRRSQFLTLESLDPATRAFYSCMGVFRSQAIGELPNLYNRETRCVQEGDYCLFNYNRKEGLVQAGCKRDFTSVGPCVDNLTDCDQAGNKADSCTVCCRGDFCNRAVAVQFYQSWLSEATTTVNPTAMSTIKRAGLARVPSLWALTAWPVTSLLAWLLLLVLPR